jgi:hypothetical protein
VYHGSASDFTKIDLTKSGKFKDFGSGFYVTENKESADRFARKRRESLILKCGYAGTRNQINAYRYNYILDRSIYDDRSLRIANFKEANIDWLRMIIYHRNHPYEFSKFDLVIGPTADARTVAEINFYLDRNNVSADELNRLISKGNVDIVSLYALIERLRPHDLPRQYCFSTERALQYLRPSNVRREIIL